MKPSGGGCEAAARAPIPVLVTHASRLTSRLARRVVSEQAGVSLIELIVTLAVLGIVIATLAGIFAAGTNAEVDLNERFQAQSRARVALTTFRRDAHRACTATFTGSTQVVLKSYATTATTTGTCTTAVATWCVVGAAAPYRLYRASGATTCSSSNTHMAGDLKTNAVFTDVPGGSGTGRLERIAVDLYIDTDLTDTRQAYRLQDSIALRNATRS
jgi:prepilin-type N-terminal cleavage/methylation domain-containing protein